MHPPAQIEFVRQQLQEKNEPYQSAYLQLLRSADKALEIPHHAPEDFNVPGYYQDPEGHWKGAWDLQTDGFNVYACALAYRLGGGEQYGIKACELLIAWAQINQRFSGYDGQLAMADAGAGMVIAAQLMSASDLWGETDRSLFSQWIMNVYRKACNEIRNKPNNGGDWGRFGSLLRAVYCNDRDEMNENGRLSKSDRGHKIVEDGSMPEETSCGEKGR